MKSVLLTVKNLSVKFGEQEVVKNVSFELREGEVLAVIGPNGSGKSVLMKTLIGIISPTSGEISWAPGVKVGYLPQRFHVDYYLPMTVAEFLQLKPNSSTQIKKIVSLAGLNEKRLKQHLAHLSSGELQKVLLAWALIDKPNILIFDEPTENVDVVGQASIYKLLQNLQETLKVALIIVSHDLHAVYRHADHVLCLNQQMICYGVPEKELTAEKLSRLYGGHHAFFHHQHHHERHSENHD